MMNSTSSSSCGNGTPSTTALETVAQRVTKNVFHHVITITTPRPHFQPCTCSDIQDAALAMNPSGLSRYKGSLAMLYFLRCRNEFEDFECFSFFVRFSNTLPRDVMSEVCSFLDPSDIAPIFSRCPRRVLIATHCRVGDEDVLYCGATEHPVSFRTQSDLPGFCSSIMRAYNDQYITMGLSTWIRDLTCDGDVESNPGPGPHSRITQADFVYRKLELPPDGKVPPCHFCADSNVQYDVRTNTEQPGFLPYRKPAPICPNCITLPPWLMYLALTNVRCCGISKSVLCNRPRSHFCINCFEHFCTECSQDKTERLFTSKVADSRHTLYNITVDMGGCLTTKWSSTCQHILLDSTDCLKKHEPVLRVGATRLNSNFLRWAALQDNCLSFETPTLLFPTTYGELYSPQSGPFGYDLAVDFEFVQPRRTKDGYSMLVSGVEVPCNVSRHVRVVHSNPKNTFPPLPPVLSAASSSSPTSQSSSSSSNPAQSVPTSSNPAPSNAPLSAPSSSTSQNASSIPGLGQPAPSQPSSPAGSSTSSIGGTPSSTPPIPTPSSIKAAPASTPVPPPPPPTAAPSSHTSASSAPSASPPPPPPPPPTPAPPSHTSASSAPLASPPPPPSIAPPPRQNASLNPVYTVIHFATECADLLQCLQLPPLPTAAQQIKHSILHGVPFVTRHNSQVTADHSHGASAFLVFDYGNADSCHVQYAIDPKRSSTSYFARPRPTTIFSFVEMLSMVSFLLLLPFTIFWLVMAHYYPKPTVHVTTRAAWFDVSVSRANTCCFVMCTFYAMISAFASFKYFRESDFRQKNKWHSIGVFSYLAAAPYQIFQLVDGYSNELTNYLDSLVCRATFQGQTDLPCTFLIYGVTKFTHTTWSPDYFGPPLFMSIRYFALCSLFCGFWVWLLQPAFQPFQKALREVLYKMAHRPSHTLIGKSRFVQNFLRTYFTDYSVPSGNLCLPNQVTKDSSITYHAELCSIFDNNICTCGVPICTNLPQEFSSAVALGNYVAAPEGVAACFASVQQRLAAIGQAIFPLHDHAVISRDLTLAIANKSGNTTLPKIIPYHPIWNNPMLGCIQCGQTGKRCSCQAGRGGLCKCGLYVTSLYGKAVCTHCAPELHMPKRISRRWPEGVKDLVLAFSTGFARFVRKQVFSVPFFALPTVACIKDCLQPTPHDSLVVVANPVRKCLKMGTQFIGLFFQAIPFVADVSLSSSYTSVTARQIRNTPKYSHQAFTDLWQFIWDSFHVMFHFALRPIPPLKWDDFVSRFPPSRRKQLNRSKAFAERHGLPKKWERRNCFLKREVTCQGDFNKTLAGKMNIEKCARELFACVPVLASRTHNGPIANPIIPARVLDQIPPSSWGDFMYNPNTGSLIPRNVYADLANTCTSQYTRWYSPRNITGWGDYIASVATGPFFVAWSKAFARGWNAESSWFYASGATNNTVGRWMDANLEGGFIYFAHGDAVKWDSCFNAQAFHVVHRIYDFLLNQLESTHNVSLFRKVIAQMAKHGLAQFKVGIDLVLLWKQRHESSRGSGDNDTTFGNSLFACVMHTYVVIVAFFELEGTSRTIIFFIRNFRVAFIGDDMALASRRKLTQAHLDKMNEVYRRLGFEYELEIAETPFAVSFMGGHFFPVRAGDSTRHVLVPELRRWLPKIGVTCNHQDRPHAWIASVGKCWRAYSFHPIINAISKCYLRVNDDDLGRVHDAWQFQRNSSMPGYTLHEDWFEALKARNPRLQHETVIDFINTINHINELPSLVLHPLIEQIV